MQLKLSTDSSLKLGVSLLIYLCFNVYLFIYFLLERNLNPKTACLKRREEEKNEEGIAPNITVCTPGGLGGSAPQASSMMMNPAGVGNVGPNLVAPQNYHPAGPGGNGGGGGGHLLHGVPHGMIGNQPGLDQHGMLP